MEHGKYLPGTTKKQIKRIESDIAHFKLDTNKLMYRKDKKSTEFKEWPKPIERRDIIVNAHLMGHFQISSTYSRVAEKFYWRGMLDDVTRVVQQCLTCQRNQKFKPMNQKANALEITYLFDRVGMDLVFGLPKTDEDYCGILVITEYLSKFPYAVPIKSKESNEIGDRLWEYICLYDPPKTVLSDQGKEFNNELVNSLLKRTGVEHRVTSAYNPRTNGQTECFNQTLIESLRKHSYFYLFIFFYFI